MKKRNIVAILAALAAVLMIFTACNGKDKPEEPSTVIGADGQVYEEVTEIVTEIVSELKTEIVTEIKTEPKTDKKGEAVTNDKGVTEVVTEIVSEVVSEIVTEIKTEVITQTIPYEPPTTTAKNEETETTTAAEQDTAPDFSGDVSVPAEEEVPFPEGELIEVPLAPDGAPKDPLMKRIMTASAESKQLYLDCVIITGETLGVETGMPCKVYMSGNSVATEFTYGVALKIRMIVHNGGVYMVFPNTKQYYQVGDASDADVGEMDMGIWESIGSAEMDYLNTSVVTVGKTKYTCETYKDSTNTNRYYFDSRQQLKRIEVETPEGDVSIIKVNNCASKVDNSIFEIPKGYKQLTEEALQGFLGALQ